MFFLKFKLKFNRKYFFTDILRVYYSTKIDFNFILILI